MSFTNLFSNLIFLFIIKFKKVIKISIITLSRGNDFRTSSNFFLDMEWIYDGTKQSASK